MISSRITPTCRRRPVVVGVTTTATMTRQSSLRPLRCRRLRYRPTNTGSSSSSSSSSSNSSSGNSTAGCSSAITMGHSVDVNSTIRSYSSFLLSSSKSSVSSSSLSVHSAKSCMKRKTIRDTPFVTTTTTTTATNTRNSIRNYTSSLFGASNSVDISDIERPTNRQLYLLFLQSAIPMIGFGLMDQTIMIRAGNAIDCTIGVVFGLSTLTAAAIGQICSDASGVLFGGTLESLAIYAGLPSAGLTIQQRTLPIVSRIRLAGSLIGVLIGCSLGLLNLLFIDTNRSTELKKLETTGDNYDDDDNDTIQGDNKSTAQQTEIQDTPTISPPPIVAELFRIEVTVSNDDDVVDTSNNSSTQMGTKITVYGSHSTVDTLLYTIMNILHNIGCCIISMSARPMENASGTSLVSEMTLQAAVSNKAPPTQSQVTFYIVKRKTNEPYNEHEFEDLRQQIIIEAKSIVNAAAAVSSSSPSSTDPTATTSDGTTTTTNTTTTKPSKHGVADDEYKEIRKLVRRYTAAQRFDTTAKKSLSSSSSSQSNSDN